MHHARLAYTRSQHQTSLDPSLTLWSITGAQSLSTPSCQSWDLQYSGSATATAPGRPFLLWPQERAPSRVIVLCPLPFLFSYVLVLVFINICFLLSWDPNGRFPTRPSELLTGRLVGLSKPYSWRLRIINPIEAAFTIAATPTPTPNINTNCSADFYTLYIATLFLYMSDWAYLCR